jgi:hypothetical protein
MAGAAQRNRFCDAVIALSFRTWVLQGDAYAASAADRDASNDL